MHLTGYCGLCRLRIGRLAALCSCAVALVLSTPVRADEGGVPFWLSGQFASLAAVLATPGWSLPPMQGHFYSGDAAASKSLPRGGGVAAGLSWRMPLVLFQPNYAPETKVLGVAFGYGRNTT